MRRRTPEPAPGFPPARLLSFDAAEWPEAATCWDALRVWKDGRRAWEAEHGRPTGTVLRLMEERRELLERLNPPRRKEQPHHPMIMMQPRTTA